MKLRVLLWWTLKLGTALTAVANLALLAQHPFAEPFVERSAARARLVLDRALEEHATPEWLAVELDAAVDKEDLDRVGLLLELAEERGMPAERLAGARQFVERETGLLARAGHCAACAIDAADCRTPEMLLACNIPVEMTVIGDARALLEAGDDALAGRPVDRLDVALAAAGIGATAIVPLTGGSSLTVKAGATTIRVARRMGVLGKGVARAVAEAADAPFRWRRVGAFVTTGRLDEVTDARRFRRLGRIADDLGTVAAHAGPAQTVALLRHVETAGDAATLARVARVAGGKTRKAVEVLGLARAARALIRFSDLVLWTLGLMAALAAQILALFARFFLLALRPPR